MNFFVLASLLVASVVAEPEAQHFSQGYVKYGNGAVTPEDTDSVKMAKAVHATAHVNAAFNGYKAPGFYYSPMVKAVAPQVNFVPTQYVAPKVQKVQVKAPAQVVGYAAPTIQHYSPLAHQMAVSPYMANPYVANPYVASPYVASPMAHRVFKREAEAEAESDAQFYYTNQYSAYGYPYGTAYGFNQRYTTPVATRPFYSAAYPFNYASYVPQRVFKREAEAEPEADAQVLFNYANAYPTTYGFNTLYNNAVTHGSALNYPVTATYSGYPYHNAVYNNAAYTYPVNNVVY